MRGSVPSRWTRTILVCGKRSRKVGDGFGPKGKTSLTKALKQRLDLPKGRKAHVGLIETGCLKLCPKRRVVAIDAARPGDWYLIERGTDIDAVMKTLGLA